MEFGHQRLEVYRRALGAVVQVQQVHRTLRGIAERRHLVDQLERAITSVVLNIAEGAGEFAAREKARFYRYAARSATESVAVLDIYQALELVPPDQLAPLLEELRIIVASLTRLAINQDKRT